MLKWLSSKNNQVATRSDRGGKGGKVKSAGSKADGVEGSSIVADNRNIYRYEVPRQEVDMQQLIDNHEPGQMFPYVSTTGDEVETQSSRINRIMRFIPSIKAKRVKVDRRLDFVLKEEAEHISLSDIVGNKVSMEFFSVPSIMFAFAPTVSMRSDFTDIYITLVDSRFRGSKIQQRLILSSNKHYKGEMCIDYSIPKVSAGNLEFSITTAVPILNTGEIWGALQVEVMLRESSFPEAIPFKEIQASATLPTTGLVEFSRDPTKLNLTLLDGHTEELREMKNRGEIPDVATAHVAIDSKMTYASSRMDSKLGASVEPSKQDWERIRRNTKSRATKQSVSPPESKVDDGETIPSEKDSKSGDIETVSGSQPSAPGEEKVVLSEDAQRILDGRKVKFNIRDIHL